MSAKEISVTGLCLDVFFLHLVHYKAYNWGNKEKRDITGSYTVVNCVPHG